MDFEGLIVLSAEQPADWPAVDMHERIKRKMEEIVEQNQCADNPKISKIMLVDKKIGISMIRESHEKMQELARLKEITDKQFAALEAAEIPADTKDKIRREFIRLVALHPTWKRHRAMRKAGEKYSVQFQFTKG